jgi:DNA polymerase III epsilon subunit-like protein
MLCARRLIGRRMYSHFVVLDLETTGLSAQRDRITEVAAIKLTRCLRPVSYVSAVVDPRQPIPPRVAQITGIDAGVVEREAVGTEADVIPLLAAFIGSPGSSVLVAHNAAFDLGFLREAAARCATPENPY